MQKLNTKDDIKDFEKSLLEQSAKFEREIQILRAQLMHLKNGAPLKNWNIKNACPYVDLSPNEAFSIYENSNIDYTVIDVSKEVSGNTHFDNSIHIPLEILTDEVVKIKQISGLILIISEQGLRSILACERLSELGVFNCFNVSGGIEFWPEKMDLAV